MKLVCMTQVYNQNTILGWDGKTNIERFMESVTKYCDGLVVFNDGSTDGTRDVITSWSGDIEIEIPSNKENTPDAEGFHRARSLEHCRRLDADWILCLDPDEVFESSVERGLLKSLAEVTVGDGIEFRCADMWRTDRYLRLDRHWSQSAGPRLFRLSDDLSFDIEPGYRSRVYPDGIKNVVQSNAKIIHYGYSSDKAILSKYKRFISLGVDLMPHLDDSSLRLCDFNEKKYGKFFGPGVEVYDKQVKELIKV